MNGLSLRISGKSKENSLVQLPHISPIKLKHSLLDKYGTLNPHCKEFLSKDNATDQLIIFKKILQTLNENVDSCLIEFLMVVYWETPSKHPLKSFLTKYITKTKALHENFGRQLECQIKEQLSSYDPNDYKSFTSKLSSIISCTENFPVGESALKSCGHVLTQFLLDSLKCSWITLCNESISPSGKCIIFTQTHNTCRALLHTIQKIDTNIDTLNSLHDILEYLMCNNETPMDTKSIAGILYVTVYWKNSVDKLRDLIILISDQVNNENITESDTMKLCLYSAIITVTNNVDTLTELSLNERPAIVYICECILSISERSISDSSIILNVARTFLLISERLNNITNKKVCVTVVNITLDYVWSNLIHYIDSVRYLCRQILGWVVKTSCELDKQGIQEPLQRIMSLSKSGITSKAISSYILLEFLIKELGVVNLLQTYCDLINPLILALEEPALRASVTHTLEVLLETHMKEVPVDVIHDQWITPLLDTIRSKSEYVNQASLTVLEGLMTKAMKADNKLVSLTYPKIQEMVKFQTSDNENNIKCALLFLNVTRKIGLKEITLSHDLIENSMIHPSQELRILAFSSIIETPKTTEHFTGDELNLCLTFLHYNINTQSSHFRQLMLALFKKFIQRFTNSQNVLKRERKNTELISLYDVFLDNLLKFSFKSLRPGANYSRRTVALQILCWCLEHKLFEGFWSVMNIERLLYHLEDSYESNKVMSLTILKECPVENFQGDYRSLKWELILKQASSVKPHECVSAAYKLDLHLHLQVYLKRYIEVHLEVKESLKYSLIVFLLERLYKELELASISILHAACQSPMYGIIYCIRHILQDIDVKLISDNQPEWNKLLTNLIETSIRINKSVECVVNNSSPEGHIPMDFDSGVEHLYGSTVGLQDGGKVTAQMILLCAWRSVKEVSLLLGTISSRFHIIGDNITSSSSGNITIEQILCIGEHFTSLLAETKHRGAFEQAYIGFSKLCLRLWRCSNEALHGLPRAWLLQLMESIQHPETADKLCATRRSAGVPFMIQALVTTELQLGGNPRCFHECMSTLIKLSETSSSVETRTHCLNILRALFRHSTLNEVVLGYVSEGLIAAINGFNRSTWAERNSSTLLFSSLMVRIFGVQRNKDSEALCIRNKMTGRIFFLRYSSLYDFLLHELMEATDNLHSTELLKPSLFPVLLILARLYPSSLEGTVSNLKLSEYIPYISKCAHSCIWNIRHLASKSIVALISPDRYLIHIQSLLEILSDVSIKRNYCHGIILQLAQLLKSRPSNITPDNESIRALTIGLTNTLWILNDCIKAQPCYILCDAYLKVVDCILKSFPEVTSTLEGQKYIQSIKNTLTNLLIINNAKLYGMEVFLSNGVNILLNLLIDTNDIELLNKMLIVSLKHSTYEVVKSSLDFLSLSSFDKNDRIMSALHSIISNGVKVCREMALNLYSGSLGDRYELIDLILYSNEDIAHVYIRALCKEMKNENILKKENCKCLTMSDNEIFVLSVVRMLYKFCSSDKSLCNREAVVDFLYVLMGWFKDSSKDLSDCLRMELHATFWSTLVTLLEDDSDTIRHKTSELIMSLSTNYSNKVIASRASEILLECIKSWYSKEYFTVFMLVIALLDFNSEVCIEDDNDENERYNIFLEESNWTEMCLQELIHTNKPRKFEDFIDKLTSSYNVFNILCAKNLRHLKEKLNNEEVHRFEIINPKIDLIVAFNQNESKE